MRKWIIIVLIALVASYIGYNYIYQDHRNIEKESAIFTMTSSEITQLFSKDIESAEKQFLNKTIEVSGLISEINTNDITINDSVFCQFLNTINNSLEKNNTVIIKGRVIGYDDLLEQVKLDQCSIIK
ncbi:OB-fold protein [Winogradskyella sp. PE311]|uniref:OB-fold protein n=1 Tax=Winogradskyella sp. PE311 TaxID=3366943 RepID=UPI00398187B0